jgi:membrane protein YqaA with SNARE-associated domain
MLIPLCIARRERSYRFAAIATLGSVLGGLIGYYYSYYYSRKTRICGVCGTENEYRALISGPADKCRQCHARLAENITA